VTAIGDLLRLAGNEATLLATTDKGIVIDFMGTYYLLNNVLYTASQELNNPNTTDPYTYCFLGGTMIATPGGEVPVEHLKPGDLVTTQDGRTVLVKWIGEQRVKNWMFTGAEKAPVCITRGALGDGLPHSDLFVSADHGMIIDGLVINASALVNHTTIRFVPMAKMPPEFTYYHVETEAHDAILANGAAAETFIDYAARKDFDNYGEYEALYGAERIIPEMDRPRISAARMVPEHIKERLAPVLDWASAMDDPAMTISLTRGAA